MFTVILEYITKKMKRIYKKYNELSKLAENSNGRKEVVSLLKKVAKLKSMSDHKIAS